MEHRYFEEMSKESVFVHTIEAQWAPKLSTLPNIFTKKSHTGLEPHEGEKMRPEFLFLVSVIKIVLQLFLIIAYKSVYSRPL